MDADHNALPIAPDNARRRKRRWPAILLIAALGAGGLAAWQIQSNASEPGDADVAAHADVQAETVMRLASVDISTIEVGTLTREVKVTGTTHPLRQAALTAQVSGVVTEVNFRPGDRVSAGDVIVQQDLRDLNVSLDQSRANMAATRAQLELAERQLNSVSALAEREFSSTASLETAQSTVATTRAQLAALEAQVEAAELAIEKATVRAPFDGIVASRAVEPNQSVSPGAPLVTIVDLSRIEARMSAPLAQAGAIVPGQTVRLAVESDASSMVTGTIDRVDPVAAEGTRSIGLYATIDNADGDLRGGMFVSGSVVVAHKDDAIGIPAAAIHEDQDGQYVLKLADGSVVLQPVETGSAWDKGATVEIVRGLVAGDRIVNTELERLEAGMLVSVAGVN